MILNALFFGKPGFKVSDDIQGLQHGLTIDDQAGDLPMSIQRDQFFFEFWIFKDIPQLNRSYPQASDGITDTNAVRTTLEVVEDHRHL